MLIRILSDNPGKTFTRNIDEKFVTTVRDLLRHGRDTSVKQILMETLDTFQRQKVDDEGVKPLVEMWKKEHEKIMKTYVLSLLPFKIYTNLNRVHQVLATQLAPNLMHILKTTSPEVTTAADSLSHMNYPLGSKKLELLLSYYLKRSSLHHLPRLYIMISSVSLQTDVCQLVEAYNLT